MARSAAQALALDLYRPRLLSRETRRRCSTPIVRRPTRRFKVLLVRAMDTSVFAEYETDLQTLLGSISAQLDGDAVRLGGGAHSGRFHAGDLPTLTRPRVYRGAKERFQENRTRT